MTMIMINKILKRFAILAAILLLATSQASFIAPFAVAAGSASLSLEGATLIKGCPGSIPINIDTGGDDIWAADVALFITGSATVTSLELGSVLPLQACNSISASEIMLCGGRLASSGVFNGSGVYGTINVTPENAGNLSFSFNNSSTHVVNDDIQDALGQAIGADYNVEERFNTEVDGIGFCDSDTTTPTISVSPQNGQNNVPLDTSIALTFSDNQSGIDLSTLTFSVNGVVINTAAFTKTGGTYIPPTPFDLGEKVNIEASICDIEGNCRQFSSSFRTTPPPPPPQCGDNTVDLGEECDDGYQTATCDRDCTLVACGDGIINDVAGEQCDDFNEVDGDGCSSSCALEVVVKEGKDVVVLKEAAPICPDVPEPVACIEIPEDEIAEEIELEIIPPPPEVSYSAEEIDEIAVETLNEQEVIEETPATVLLPEIRTEVITRLDECRLEYGDLNFDFATDSDNDGLSDKTECYAMTNPFVEDSDNDGCLDGDEINQYASDPLNGSDCSIEEKREIISISSPQAGWLLSRLEVTGLTPNTTSLVNIIAFPVVDGEASLDQPIQLGTIKQFNTSSIEDQYFFKVIPEVELPDGKTYDLIAIGVLTDGKTITSDTIRFILDSNIDILPPEPSTIGNVTIDKSMKLRNIRVEASEDGKVEVTGKSEYGAQVFAVWESVVLASSIIADSTLGEFTIKSPRPLSVGEDHAVTIFSVKNTNGQKLKSENIAINFHIVSNKTTRYILYLIIILTILAFVAFYMDERMKNKKKNKALTKKLVKEKLSKKHTKA